MGPQKVVVVALDWRRAVPAGDLVSLTKIDGVWSVLPPRNTTSPRTRVESQQTLKALSLWIASLKWLMPHTFLKPSDFCLFSSPFWASLDTYLRVS